jgi:hypothetical protein
MFDNIKLEKGLYNLSGKTFLQALEEADPNEDYVDTPLKSLDAYERQLKRFNIKTNGAHCDRVEKFFSTTESAVLFPEYLKRCILQGIEDSHIGDIVAVKTVVDTTSYKGLTLVDSSSYYNNVAEGATMSDSSIFESSVALDVKKLARIINCSYEVIRQQKIDMLSLQLRVVGRKLGLALYSKALTAVTDSATTVSTASKDIAYSDLVNLFGSFTTYDANTIVASPAVCAAILQLPEVAENCCCNASSDIVLPFGAKLIKSTSLDNTKVVALDRNFALEYVTTSDINITTDTLINRQLDRVAVGIPYLFRTISADAMKVLTVTQ